MWQILIVLAGMIGLLVLWTTAVAAVIVLVFFAFSFVSLTGPRRPRGREPLLDTQSRDVRRTPVLPQDRRANSHSSERGAERRQA